MHPTTYTRATDAAGAISTFGNDESAKFLAGGTTLVDLMKLDVETPRRLIDISRLPLAEIRRVEGGLHIGAAATNTAVADHADVKSRFPALSQAILSGASQQIRNMASVGGNLLQRVRCPYFRDGISPCNKRVPGSGCSAKGGVETSLAVLGTSDACYAAHPSDMAVALLALGAVVHVESSNGKREIPIADFHTLPGDTPHVETTLKRGELITGVFVPDAPASSKSLYVKMRDRASYEFALASCAAVVGVVDGKISHARIALGGVGAKPWHAADAEKALLGNTPGLELFEAAASAALKDARPLPGNAFKVELARRVIVKTLKMLLEG